MLFNLQTGRGRLIAGSSLALLLLLIWLGVRQFSPLRHLEKKQAAVYEAIEKRSANQVFDLMAEDYSDRWGLDREKASRAIRDLGQQFLVLSLAERDRQVVIDGLEAEIQTGLVVSGKGSPIAQTIIRRTNGFEEPFTFTWRRTFWPWSWVLIRIEQPEIPDDLDGYEPGEDFF